MRRKVVAACDDRFLAIGNEVAECWLKGMSHRQIGEKFGITFEQSRQVMRKCRAMWRKKNERKITAKIEQELAKLDLVESEAWLAWEKSKQDEVVRIRSKESTKLGPTTKRQTRRRGQAGDPRFLEVALKCVEKRCSIMGVGQAEEKSKNEVPFGILVVVDNPDQADRVLSYQEFERARALAVEGVVDAIEVVQEPEA